MILLYSHKVSSRLLYTCSFILKELLGVDFKLTIDSEKFKNHEGPKINYSNLGIDEAEFHLHNTNLLFEDSIKHQNIDCFAFHNTKKFFKTPSGDFPFDVLAASFYLLSRYEEYLPHKKDEYGRYDCKESLAYREGFLNMPLINIWVQHLAIAIQKKFPNITIQPPVFQFLPTYDIDIAWSYKHKGFLRTLGGFLKSPSIERIKVLTGFQKDPFDCYDWLHQIHQQQKLYPLYFFLVAEKNGPYDKQILPHKDAMWKLVRKHSKKYEVGMHPSWQSGDDNSLLKKELEQLREMCSDGVANRSGLTSSRQHYIRFNLPRGYQQLLKAGITNDYSMGYGSINGFRASVASSFFWYDLENEQQTNLRIHPFCFMDANSFYEQRQNPLQTSAELVHYLKICKEVNGTLISIWHNNFLGNAKECKGWKELYENFIFQVRQ